MRTQALKTPAKWYLAAETIGGNLLPRIFLWPGLKRPTLILYGARKSGVYGVRAPLVYQLRNQRWQLVSTQPGQQEFTDRGAFTMRSNKLYVWDYAAEEDLAHYAPQKYWLKIFVLKQGKLYLQKRLLTKRRYSDLDYDDDRPCKVPASRDPLREFGLRWEWWGHHL